MKYSWASKIRNILSILSASCKLSSTPLCKLEQRWQTPQRYPSARALPVGFSPPQRLIDFSGSPQKTCFAWSYISCANSAGLFRMITGAFTAGPFLQSCCDRAKALLSDRHTSGICCPDTWSLVFEVVQWPLLVYALYSYLRTGKSAFSPLLSKCNIL